MTMTYQEIGKFLEHHGLSDEQIDAYFEHHGVKGQKWGVVTRKDRSAGRKEVFNTSMQARQILNKVGKSTSETERAQLAKQYEETVVKRINTPEWKQAYKNANSMGKGEQVAHILMLGPFAALTIPAAKQAYQDRQITGYAQERETARTILKSIQSA